MPTVFVLTRLKKDVDQSEYEKWVKEYDYPTAEKYFKSITSYRAYRVADESKGKIPYDFVERIDISDYEAYQRDMETPEFAELIRQIGQFLETEESVLIYAEPIE